MIPCLIALTGATGFIGRNLLRTLLGEGFLVRALTRGRHASRHRRLTWVGGTLEDARALEALVADCDAVIHVAGAIRGCRYADFASINVDGTERLLSAVAERAPQAHVINVSSLAASQPDLSWYATSKRLAEDIVAGSTARFSVVRPPVVYGPDDPALALLWRSLANGWLLRPGPADARFSLLHVDELAEALVRLVRYGPTARVMALHDGRTDGYGWPEIAEVGARRRGGPVRTIPIPRSLMTAAAQINLGCSVLMRRSPLFTPGKVRELSHPRWVCDNVDIHQALNWAPSIHLEDRLDTLPGWKAS
jgi:2-alkyl-3-oxoalkanoate reductase